MRSISDRGLTRVSTLTLLNLGLTLRREGRASRLGDTVRSSMRLACVCAARSGSSSARNSMAAMARLASTSCAADPPSPPRTHTRDSRGLRFLTGTGVCCMDTYLSGTAPVQAQAPQSLARLLGLGHGQPGASFGTGLHMHATQTRCGKQVATGMRMPVLTP